MVKVLLQKGGVAREFNRTVLEWLRDVKGWEVTEPKYLTGEPTKQRWNYLNPKAKLYVWPKEWETYWTKEGSLHIVEEHLGRGEDYDDFIKIFYTDPDLIEAVETIGDDNFKVVEIPDDADWDLEEDYGVYVAVEKHRTWS